MGVRIRLDRAGIRNMLKSHEVAAAVGEMAEQVAEHVRADEAVQRHEMPVKTSAYVTDRAAVAVDIDHPGGLGVQAKYGTLTRAAGAVGLEVRERA